MLPLATNWTTISALATGAGTLVLALATFASVRSSNRSARIAEAALQEQRRPVLAPSRLSDPVQKLMFVEGRWLSAAGGRAAVEHADGRVYLAISLRNVGSGIGVCQGWTVRTGLGSARNMPAHAELEEFRPQTRDLYVPAGDIGMWQGALRDPDDPVRAVTADAIDARQPITVELFYTDQIGRQRTIVRLNLIPAADSWLAIVNRYWYLDWVGPRPEGDVLRAAETIQQEQEAAERQSAGVETSSAGDETSEGGETPPEGEMSTATDGGGLARAADRGDLAAKDGAAAQAEQADTQAERTDARGSRQAGTPGDRS
jgi:hypothetical protein